MNFAPHTTRTHRLIACAITAGFFLLLAAFSWLDMWGRNIEAHGGIVTLYQALRLASVGYLCWLQYAVGGYILWCLARRAFPFVGLAHAIASFLVGTAFLHVLLLLIGLIGGYEYVFMLLLSGTIMIASLPHLAHVVSKCKVPVFTRTEWLLAALALAAAISFLLMKGTYPTGGRDFYNHYFPYYLQVIRDSNLGPNGSWLHYFFSKGLGLYFMAMILFDPMAVHLVGAGFILLAAAIIFHFLSRPGRGYALPLWGITVYLALFCHTPGRGIFAANGGWGHLEKAHEIGAVMVLGCLWLMQQALVTRSFYYAFALCMAAAGLVLIYFANGILIGLFFACVLIWQLFRRDMWGVRVAFAAGCAALCIMLATIAINYVNTGIFQEQLVQYTWPLLNFKRIMAGGYSLELYSHLRDMQTYGAPLPFFKTLPGMLKDHFRLALLWPLALLSLMLLATSGRQRPPAALAVLLLFLLASFLFATFFGGRSQFISFFRYSVFNYAPMVIVLLLCWQNASPRSVKLTITAALVAAMLLVPEAARRDIRAQFASAFAFASGKHSLRDALADQQGRPGATEGGGIYPAMEMATRELPAQTRVWSLGYQTYCMLPSCRVEEYFSQVTSPRWYEIALGSVEEGKRILKEEGLNYIFYSRSVPLDTRMDAKDQLAGFYKGLAPEHIQKTYGIYWTNGWDYLLTWKENSRKPLDKDFMDSWLLYHKQSVEPRKRLLPVETLARQVKEAVETRAKHPPAPDW